jgi:hypothetical protein
MTLKSEKAEFLSETEMQTITLFDDSEDLYNVAVELSALYRLELGKVYDLLKQHYTDMEVPLSHITALKEQIEAQTKKYKVTEEEVEVALALVKLQGFDKEERDGKTIYTTEIIYHKDNEELLLHYENFKGRNKKEFSFHYSPYKMDSHPEKDFFDRLLESLNENPDDVDDIYFTGAITDANKTDFLFEYKDKKGKYRNYTPDFVIKKKDGKVLIVEVKAEQFREQLKEMALEEIEKMNKDRIKYELLLTDKDELKFGEFEKVKQWVYSKAK